MTDQLHEIGDPAGAGARPRLTPFALGFRPFFLGSALYALLAMGLWTLVYRGATPPGVDLFGPPMWWHAHAMVFGYALAVVAGFLLTAVRNWTGIQTARGWTLGGLFSLWAAARVMPHLGAPLVATAVVDVLFGLGLVTAVTIPLVRAGRWRDVATFSTKLLTITVANALVYLAAMGIGSGLRVGLYLGLYVVLAIILTIGKRVFAFFIERGLEGDVELPRAPGLAKASLASFLAFVVVDLVWPGSVGSAALASCVALVNGRRLVLWAHPGVWRRPLLWVLVLAYAWIVAGFALLAAEALGLVRPLLAVHALTTGGVGMVTVGMMARVSLGHTGREIYAPRPLLGVCFGALMGSAVVRVLVPLTGLVEYGLAMLVSQVLWMVAFAIFVGVYAPILMTARVDGKPG